MSTVPKPQPQPQPQPPPQRHPHVPLPTDPNWDGRRGLMQIAQVHCPTGEELVGEDDHFLYCEPRQYTAAYDRFSKKYGFLDRSWFRHRTAWHDLNSTATKNLAYFRRFVLPRLNLSRDDAILVAWWAYIEGPLKGPYNTPWGFVNCKEHEINDTKGLDCKSSYSGGWQVGYGVQVYDNLKVLPNVFKRIYPNSLPKEVGNKVLTGAEIKLKFPVLLDWQTLSKLDRVDNVLGSGRSNHFWASILMRDPKISASLVATILSDPKKFSLLPQHPKWCDPYYRKRQQHSEALHSIINAWKNLDK